MILIMLRPSVESTPELIKNNFLLPEIMKEHGGALFEKEAMNSVNSILRATNNISPFFITSFCIHDQGTYEYSHGLLSQWRGYARSGFAIEFDELQIDAMNKAENEKWRYQGFITDTVSYESYEERVKPEQFQGMAGAFLRVAMEQSPRSASQRWKLKKILGAAQVGDFVRPFLSVAPFLKHYGFREEAEYRIVALCNRPTKSDPGDTRGVKEIKFRSRLGGNVVPYIALYDGLEKQLPIKGIIIGPHAQQENQRLAAELLLEQCKVKAQIRMSEIPFRA